MKRKKMKMLFFLFLASLYPGCAPKSFFTNRMAPVPVMVGPVTRIQGRPHESGPALQPLEVEIGNHMRLSNNASGTTFKGELSNPMERAVFLMKSECAKCVIRIESIRVGSWYLLLPAWVEEKNWIVTTGALHASENE